MVEKSKVITQCCAKDVEISDWDMSLLERQPVDIRRKEEGPQLAMARKNYCLALQKGELCRMRVRRHALGIQS
jgi:hypothetical protein